MKRFLSENVIRDISNTHIAFIKHWCVLLNHVLNPYFYNLVPRVFSAENGRAAPGDESLISQCSLLYLIFLFTLGFCFYFFIGFPQTLFEFAIVFANLAY